MNRRHPHSLPLSEKRSSAKEELSSNHSSIGGLSRRLQTLTDRPSPALTLREKETDHLVSVGVHTPEETSKVVNPGPKYFIQGLTDIIQQISALRQKNRSGFEKAQQTDVGLDDPRELAKMKFKLEELTK